MLRPILVAACVACVAGQTPNPDESLVNEQQTGSGPQCAVWCLGHTKKWEDKCHFTSCGGCNPCGTAAACQPWCIKHAKPWKDKCTFKACAGCSACPNSAKTCECEAKPIGQTQTILVKFLSQTEWPYYTLTNKDTGKELSMAVMKPLPNLELMSSNLTPIKIPLNNNNNNNKIPLVGEDSNFIIGEDPPFLIEPSPVKYTFVYDGTAGDWWPDHPFHIQEAKDELVVLERSSDVPTWEADYSVKDENMFGYVPAAIPGAPPLSNGDTIYEDMSFEAGKIYRYHCTKHLEMEGVLIPDSDEMIDEPPIFDDF